MMADYSHICDNCADIETLQAHIAELETLLREADKWLHYFAERIVWLSGEVPYGNLRGQIESAIGKEDK